MALVPVTTVGLIGSLQAHSNIGRLCSQFNISDDELVQIVKDEQCIKVKVGNIKLSFKDIIGNNNNVKCVLVDRIKNTIGNCDDTRLRDLLAYISGALYTTVAHAMHSQIMQAFGNQGWAHWARNSEIETNFELSSMIATKRYGADESTAAELTKVKGKGTVKRTQHIADANYIIVDVDLVIHSVAIDALRMMQLVRDRVDDPDEFVKRIKRSGIDSEMVLGGSGWPCTIL